MKRFTSARWSVVIASVAAAAALFAPCALSLLAAPAPAPAGGITVLVTNASLGPVQNVTVQVKNSSGGSVSSTLTDGTGTAAFTGLAAGSYYVRTSNTLGYVDVWNGGAVAVFSPTTVAGTAVSVTDGGTANIAFALNQGGRISGTVKNVGGNGIGSVHVKIYDATNRPTTTNYWTASNGSYATDSLPAGTYYARTTGNLDYLNETHDDLPYWTPTTSSTGIGVTSGGTAAVDFVLLTNPGPNTFETAIEIPTGLTNHHYTSGYGADTTWRKFYVPPEDAGKDLKVQLRVTSPYPDPPPTRWRSDLDFDLVDADGKARGALISGSDNETVYLHEVSSGWYYIYMSYCTTQYADNDLAAAFTIDVQTGTNFGVGYITGRLVDAGGAPVPQVFIEAFSVPAKHNISFQTITSRADGTFAIAVLPSARTLFFNGDLFDQPSDYRVVQPHQVPANVVDASYSGNPVTATVGNTTDLGDISVTVGSIVTGRVTDGAGAPILGASVSTYKPDGTASNSTFSNANGTFRIVGVATGGAKVRFSRSSYAPEYYDDQPSLGSGTLLPTETGVTFENVNGALTSGGTISGTLQKSTGGAAAASVRLYSVLDPANYITSVTSSASTGGFSLTHVKPGEYKLLFAYASVGYLEEWYDNVASFDAASTVTVTEGGTTAGIVAQLVPAAAEMDVNQAGTPVASGGTQAFGSRMVGTDTGIVFTVNDTGSGGLTLSGFSTAIKGADAGDFSFAPFPAATLPPGASTTFTLWFHPTSAGPKTAYISLTTNDADENPYIINLTGTGITEKLTPTITWADPAPMLFGTPLGPAQLNATADVGGTFEYTPAAGTLLATGTHTLAVLFTPIDPANYTPAAADVSLEVVARSGGVRSDVTGDGKSDVLWRHATQGDVWLWAMAGAAKTAETYVRTVGDTNFEIRAVGDFDADGDADLMWRNAVSGDLYFWPMNGAVPEAAVYVGRVNPAYDIVGNGDVNGDGTSDLLWRHTAWGDVWIWLMDGATPLAQVYVDRVDPAYVVKGVGDLDADGNADIIWHHATLGEVWAWPMNGTTRLDQVWVGTVPDTGYQIQGVADFTGNGQADLVWWHATRGEVWLWTMDGPAKAAETWVGTVLETDYRIAGTGDYDGDGKADLLWHHATRSEVWVWLMDAATKLSETWVGTVPDTGYRVVR